MNTPSVDLNKVRAALARSERIRAAGALVAANRENSLARANGRGSAGQCPASRSAKTPAVRESVCRVAAIRREAGDFLTDASVQRPEPVGAPS